jgi:lipopolysaccharide biosynthesis protein
VTRATKLVSTAPFLDQTDSKILANMNISVHVRENVGLDFGWALRHVISLDQVDWLLLANDSVFGPIFDLASIFSAQISAGPDFWGITDSYQHAWHVQSYFVCLRGDVVRSASFREVFAQDFTRSRKQTIVDDGEIFLSQALGSAGYKGSMKWPP